MSHGDLHATVNYLHMGNYPLYSANQQESAGYPKSIDPHTTSTTRSCVNAGARLRLTRFGAWWIDQSVYSLSSTGPGEGVRRACPYASRD